MNDLVNRVIGLVQSGFDGARRLKRRMRAIGSQAFMNGNPITLVYISSYSRSGSTLLDMVLGNHPAIFSAGELLHLMTSGWANNEPCACGVPVRGCLFWSGVMVDWQAEIGGNAGEYVKLQSCFERLRGSYRHFVAGLDDSRSFKRYSDLTSALLAVIARRSGRTIIVDSSKQPIRALALNRVTGLDVRYLHLVRDSRAVANSLARPYKKDTGSGIANDIPGVSPYVTALHWLAFNAVLSATGRKIAKENRMLLRYEDLALNPAQSLDRLCGFIGIDGRPFEKCLHANHFTNGHQVAGNRVRMKKGIALQVDEAWRTEMPELQQRIVGALAFPSMALYGYGGQKPP